MAGLFYNTKTLPKEGQILVVPISESETQVFEMHGIEPVLKVIDNPWLKAQQLMIRQAVSYATTETLSGSIAFIPGTSHFGHSIGDQLGIIICTIARLKSNPAPSFQIILANPPDSILKILHLLGYSANLLVIRTSNRPLLLRSNENIVISTLNTKIPLSLHAGMAVSAQALDKAISKKIKTHSLPKQNNIMLTSGRTTRIANLHDLVLSAKEKGWDVVNPTRLSLLDTLIAVRRAPKLISENGSILFNCFLSRTMPYTVLASPRVYESSEEWSKGGYIYNQYHDGLLAYKLCELNDSSPKHPYSDQIKAPVDIFEK